MRWTTKAALTLVATVATMTALTGVAAGPGPDASHPFHRAINVQLARVAYGQSRTLRVSPVGWSAAALGMICPIPKLIVRFESPILTALGYSWDATQP